VHPGVRDELAERDLLIHERLDGGGEFGLLDRRLDVVVEGVELSAAFPLEK
jgi:hypothetical protein